MNQESSSNSSSVDQLAEILDEMKSRGKLKGVILANRNGDLIAENMGVDKFDGTTFAAMCASVLESADDLRKDLGVNKVFKIITELESGKIIIIIELDKKRFYSFVLGKQSKIEPILNDLDNYNQKIIEAY